MNEMTTIRATCPSCGEVEMDAQAILLSVRDDDGEGTYSFTCPVCRDTVEKPADRKVVMLLLSAGVDVTRGEQVDVPTEEVPADLPPLTADDLIDFHFMLERDEEWFARLAG
ncbi:MAG TPA: hypothetical protein VM638_02210 [Actinomycetota bacterium]|nr:hypothetical protein [Actinomycetota bacterium]